VRGRPSPNYVAPYVVYGRSGMSELPAEIWCFRACKVSIDERIQYARPCLPVTKPPPNNRHRLSRRGFTQQAAVAAVAVLSSGTALSRTHDLSDQSGVSSGLLPEQAEEVEAKLANIVRKYGDRLTQEQRQRLRRILTNNERMLAAVRAFPLQNGDSPASVLNLALPKKGSTRC
jgi:hypothetical protein